MKDQYDCFIKRMPSGSFRQSYAWGDVMAYDNEIIRLALENDGVIEAAISIQKRVIPGTKYSFFYAPRGPIIDFTNKLQLPLLMNEIKKVAKANKAVFLRIDPDIVDKNGFVRQCLEKQGFKHLNNKNWSAICYPRILMRVDIRPEEKLLLKSMRQKHRQHINTINKKGVTISEIRDYEGLAIFHEMMKRTGERKGFTVRDIEYYKKLFDIFGDDRRLLMAKRNDTYLCGVFSLVYGNKCWYMHGSSNGNKGNLHPNEALHWQMIIWAKSRGAIFYDLGGTGTDYPPEENNPNYNLYLFKKGFNADITYLTGYYDLVFLPLKYKIFRFLEEKTLSKGMKIFQLFKRT